MKSLFNPTDNQEIVDRINKLSPSTAALWGKMTVSQMLAHTQQPLKVALGEAKASHSLVGKLFGGIAKRQLMADKPMKRNLPTDKTFLVRDERDFEQEKRNLVSLVERFKAGSAVLTKQPHPFFGRLTDEEWDKLSWKHLDHHLQQFGV